MSLAEQVNEEIEKSQEVSVKALYQTLLRKAIQEAETSEPFPGRTSELVGCLVSIREHFAPQGDVAAAIRTIAEALQDENYRLSWHASLSMAFIDAGGDVVAAQKGAERFLAQAFGVKTEVTSGDDDE